MDNESTILEGISKIENPLASEIRMELDYLKNKKSEFVILSKGEHFIQTIRDNKKRGYFYVEVNSNSTSGLCRKKDSVSLSILVKMFRDFQMNSSVNTDDTWERVENKTSLTDKSKKTNTYIFVFIAITILIATTFAAISSNRPWYEGMVAGMFAVAYITCFVEILVPYYKNINRKLIKKSIDMGMPCEIYSLRRITVLNPKQKNGKKLFKLELLLFGYIFLGIFIILGILTAFIGLAFLVQTYTPIWN